MGHYQARGSATLEGVFQERLGPALAPCEKTACIQDLYFNEFLWRFFRKGVSAEKIIKVEIKEVKIYQFSSI